MSWLRLVWFAREKIRNTPISQEIAIRTKLFLLATLPFSSPMFAQDAAAALDMGPSAEQKKFHILLCHQRDSGWV